jgi:hypothetical protein
MPVRRGPSGFARRVVTLTRLLATLAPRPDVTRPFAT